MNESIPARQKLMEDLERLKEVSARNEQLSKRVSEGEQLSDELMKEMESCVAEQSRIVDSFIHLCADESELKKIQSVISRIEGATRKLEAARDEQEAALFKEEILHGIEEWIESLEVIITGVLSRAA
ncbi:MAG: hypothetical protein V2A78_09915 [bacterium]